jgi:hypothetical protein
MFKQLANVLCTGFVTLMPGAHLTAQSAEGKPSIPLYPTVFLKLGEAQQLVLSAPEFLVGAYDRTAYDFTPVSEKGDKTSALKGITIEVDRQRMGELLDRYGDHCLDVKFSSTADAEPGKFLIRVRALRFGGTNYFETTVRLTIAK